MSLIWLAAAAALTCLLSWSLLSPVARIGGGLLILDSLLALVAFPHRAPAAHLEWLGTGIVGWLAGHWIWALQHRAWRSILAMRVFALPLLRSIVPRDLR